MLRRLFRRPARPDLAAAIAQRIAELTAERARVLASYDAAIGELQKLIAPQETTPNGRV